MLSAQGVGPSRNAGDMAGFAKCGAPPPTEISATAAIPRIRGNRFMLMENLRIEPVTGE